MVEKVSSRGQETKDRLNKVLVQDRTGLSVHLFESLRDDLIALLSSYIEIDPGALELNLQVNGRAQRLIAVIPLPPAGRHQSIHVE
jgi:cell division topological specificity factor